VSTAIAFILLSPCVSVRMVVPEAGMKRQVRLVPCGSVLEIHNRADAELTDFPKFDGSIV